MTTWRVATTKSKTGGYPSGQRGQTVNLVAQPSQVRILLHPCWLFQQGRSIARGCSSVVEPLPSKQAAWVRFPSPALGRKRKHGGRDDRDGVSGPHSARSSTNRVMILKVR